jgi:oxygen-independent coproporphyrinogen-3 oxidase
LSPTSLTPPRAAYVHVPFCRHRCGYCDFTLVAGRDDLIDGYLAAIERELTRLETPRPVETRYLGGGTPTHLPAAALRRLLATVARWLPLDPGGEYSVEANPAGLDEARLDVLVEAGVNRVSLGVQSFDARQLATLERDHSPHDVVEVVTRLRPRIPNISFDLIFAVPGQSLADWRNTLTAAVALSPPHLSTYGLTWERGTSFWSRRARGTWTPVDEETERAMYECALDELVAAGYEQYELSNFARPGSACRHNHVYWRGDSYYGFGPGAASYVNGVRTTNHRSVTTWLRRTLAGESAVQEQEHLTGEQRAREAVMLGLRQRAGIDLDEFRQRHGCTPAELEPRAWRQHLEDGLLEVVHGRVRLTRAGCFLADRVVADFL